MKVFELEQVCFAYTQQTVFEQLDFAVPAGGFVALVGPNGAGKSTLLKLCLGLLKPSAGRVHIMGQAVGKFRDWTKIGYVPQNPLADRSFPVTVEEIVAMGRVAAVGIGRLPGKADREIVTEALDIVGITNLRQRLINELSGGQQQRVMVARALASRPQVLVLDEPAAGVDSSSKDSLYRLLKKLNQEMNTTILAVSHDVDKIARYAGQIACIDNGLNYCCPASLFQDRLTGTVWDSRLKRGGILNA